VGGIAGSTSQNETSHSYSTSIVTGTESNTGGLVGSGKNERIVNSYSAGVVTGVKGSTGGLAGVVDSGSYIIHNYSVSKVNVIGIKDFASGLVGYNQGAYTIGNYGIKTDMPGEKSKTIAEMKQKATFANWDFKSIWGISDTINCGYPHLLGFSYNVGCGVESP